MAPMRHVTVDAGAAATDAVIAARGAGADLIVLLHRGEVLAGAVDVETAEGAAPNLALSTIADADPPATRPSVTAEELVPRIREDALAWLAVTTAGGRFLGAIDGAAVVDLARHDRLP